MAQIEDGIVAQLLTSAALVAVVKDKVRVAVLDEGDNLPGVVIVLTGDTRDNSLDGYGGQVHLSCTVWCASKRWQEAREISELCRAALEAFDGTAGSFTFCVETIDGRTYESQPLAEGSQDYWHAIGLQVRISYQEDV